jgi:hypothetical protein
MKLWNWRLPAMTGQNQQSMHSLARTVSETNAESLLPQAEARRLAGLQTC